MKLRIMLIDDNQGRAALLQQALRDTGYQVVATLSCHDNLLEQVQEVAEQMIAIVNLLDR